VIAFVAYVQDTDGEPSSYSMIERRSGRTRWRSACAGRRDPNRVLERSIRSSEPPVSHRGREQSPAMCCGWRVSPAMPSCSKVR
jgi:hypothetical protein